MARAAVLIKLCTIIASDIRTTPPVRYILPGMDRVDSEVLGLLSALRSATPLHFCSPFCIMVGTGRPRGRPRYVTVIVYCVFVFMIPLSTSSESRTQPRRRLRCLSKPNLRNHHRRQLVGARNGKSAPL